MAKATSTSQEAAGAQKQKHGDSPKSRIGGIGLIDLLRVLGGVLLVNASMSYFVTGESVTWGWRPWWSQPQQLAVWWVRSLLGLHVVLDSSGKLTLFAERRHSFNRC